MKKIYFSIVVVASLLVGLLVYFYGFAVDDQVMAYDEEMIAYDSTLEKPLDLSDNSVTFPGFKEITITETQKDFYIALANPNFNKVDIQFTLLFDEDDNVLKKTGLIKPGFAVTHIELPEVLAIGKHKINVKIKAYIPEDNETQLTGVETSFVLKVVR